ncbi:MAG: DUF4351 domain-containing protein, partial [Thermosynechococcaceae cyanobacterium]
KGWKLRLIRGLYDKGYSRQDILNLYKFIDWAMILPAELEQECWSDLKAFEEERKVTYVTSGERIGFERGIAQEKALVLRQLARRVGSLPANIETQFQALDLNRVEALGEALLDFTQLSDLTDWLQEHL